MATYEFTLTFALASANAEPATFLDALFEAGCDDATVGVGRQGSIALDFSREAPSAENAIRTAVASVRRAIPGAQLLEVKPDLVNLTDVAELVGVSRQNIRKYAAGEMRTVQMPFPIPCFSGTPSLWHLYEIAVWLFKHTDLRPPREIVELSLAAYKINLEAQRRHVATLPKEKELVA
jgi:hypothetical protein